MKGWRGGSSWSASGSAAPPQMTSRPTPREREYLVLAG
jgi:hypothetical protein